MPHPYPMASVFTEGMRQDVDRTMLPGGSVWNLVDFIPDELGVAAMGRGGWQDEMVAADMSGASKIESVSLAPFDAGARLIVIDQQPKMWSYAFPNTSAVTGTPNIPGGPPAYHRGKLIIPNNDGTTSVKYYDGTTLGTLGGSPPTGQLASVYKDHAILANASGHLNRIWFSAPGDPTTWDTSFGWWDTTGTITAVATTLNAILIFHGDTTERLRGTTPPPGSDFVLEPFLQVGCIDPFSVAYWNQRVVFASKQGIFLTDGATYVDLTAKAQMKNYWQTTVSSYQSSWRIAAGIYRDHYIISINNGSTLVDCFCVSLNNETMWRFSNVHGSSFASVTGQSFPEQLYMGRWNGAAVARADLMWSPQALYKQDTDGHDPTPIIETGAFRGWDRLHRRWIQSMGLQKWRWAYLDYDLEDAASDNPTITLSYATTPTGSYTNVAGGTFPETTDYSRGLRSLGTTYGGAKRSTMIEFKIAVNGPYKQAKIYTLEASFEPIEIGRLR